MAAPVAVNRGIQPDRHQMEQLMELQTRGLEMRQHVVRLSNQIAALERERTVARITMNHIDSLEDDIVTYRPLGKCFILESHEGLNERMKSSMEKYALDIDTKLKLRDQFLTKIRENEVQLEELMDALEKTAKK
eukprot:CAMPEP_0184706164 /NCGR_PEP_ID=MMETSP0313-20130426/36614_1 /TAXON_ID=2792 /ORGANISM="Porphyridium aerugineum, Strain SAG 1380-2" /LENGTH=133 /DNA_ID=CAMNT_0027167711 /DNA_START=109 /DNA_END=510 /DNA_ORIENTATION=-